jgi:hypothetical protein
MKRYADINKLDAGASHDVCTRVERRSGVLRWSRECWEGGNVDVAVVWHARGP